MELAHHDIAFSTLGRHLGRRFTVIIDIREDGDLVLPSLQFESSVLAGICSQWLAPPENSRGHRTL